MLPTETYEEILRLLPASSLWHAGNAGKKFADLRSRIFSARWKAILTPFLSDDDMEWLARSMLKSEAAIVGPSALSFMEPGQDRKSTTLDIATPSGRSKLITDFFESRGCVHFFPYSVSVIF